MKKGKEEGKHETGGRKSQATLQQKIEDFFRIEDYKKCLERIETLTNSKVSIEVLRMKMKCEEKLDYNEKALTTANFVLFLSPLDFETHQFKIHLLKKMELFSQLSDSLMTMRKIYPDKTLK